MANLTLSSQEMRSRRFARYLAECGIDRRTAMGALLLFWDHTRQAEMEHAPEATLLAVLEGPSGERAQVLAAMAKAGYICRDIQSEDGPWTIQGNARAIDLLRAARARGRKGGLRSRIKRTRRAAAVKDNVQTAVAPQASMGPDQTQALHTAFQAACHATWMAYARAYEVKTTCLPSRNAKINAQIKQVVQRCGMAEAPGVLQFYVERVTDKRVIQGLWPLGMFLAGAEGYMTQWRLGRPLHEQAASGLSQQSAYQQRQADILSGRI